MDNIKVQNNIVHSIQLQNEKETKDFKMFWTNNKYALYNDKMYKNHRHQ